MVELAEPVDHHEVSDPCDCARDREHGQLPLPPGSDLPKWWNRYSPPRPAMTPAQNVRSPSIYSPFVIRGVSTGGNTTMRWPPHRSRPRSASAARRHPRPLRTDRKSVV